MPFSQKHYAQALTLRSPGCREIAITFTHFRRGIVALDSVQKSSIWVKRPASKESMVPLFGFLRLPLFSFTASDFKTIIGPSFVFGLANAPVSRNYGIKSAAIAPSKLMVRKLPLSLLWIWINLLPFNINNQGDYNAIKEDSLNKAWRPLPPGRMTPGDAKALVFVLYPVAVGMSYFVLGGLRQSVVLLALDAWYNNFAGSNANFLVRNLLNALGYVWFTSGTIEVTLGSSLPLNPSLTYWFGVIATVILTTIH